MNSLSVAERNALVLENKGMVYEIAHICARRLRHVSRDDFVQEGFLGMIRASQLFEPSLGYKFITYASQHVWAAMGRLVDYEHLLSGMGPRHNARRTPEIEAARQLALNTFPTSLNSSRRPNSSGDGEGSYTLESRVASKNPGPEELADEMERARLARRLLDQLTPKQREAVEAWAKGETGKGLADRHGVSRQAIQQRLVAGLAALQELPDVANLRARGGP